MSPLLIRIKEIMATLQSRYPRPILEWRRGDEDGSDGNYFFIANIQLDSLRCKEVPRIVWSHLGAEYPHGQSVNLFDVYLWGNGQDDEILIDTFCTCLTADQLVDRGDWVFDKWSNPRQRPQPHYRLKVQITVPLGFVA